jgi:hypothetical protein
MASRFWSERDRATEKHVFIELLEVTWSRDQTSVYPEVLRQWSING